MNRGVLSLRAKLVVLVALPLVVLLAITSITAADRARVVSRADVADRDVRGAFDAAALVAPLRAERDRTNRFLADPDEGSTTALAEARVQTDAAVTGFGDAVASLSAGAEARFGGVTDRLSAIADTRLAVDGGRVERAAGFAWYGDAIDAVLAATGAVDVGDGAGLDRLTFDVEALSRAVDALAVERDVIAAAGARGDLTSSEFETLVRAWAAQDIWRAEVSRIADPASVSALGRVFDQQAGTVVADARAQAAEGAQLDLDVDEASWTAAAGALVDGVDAVRASASERLLAGSADARRAAGEERDLYLGASVLSLAMLAAITFLVGRWVRRPISALTAAAVDVARRRLPAAVAAAADPTAPSVDVEPVQVEGGDELGQLADAFNQMQATAVALASEQAAMRRDVNELFISLGRRNQKLVSRQLAFIDRLEKREQDPEVLQNLFRLDHLATRMRRNAESLLVLAGTETPRTWLAPVEVGDTIRAAVSEVEQYERVDIRSVGSAHVRGNVSANVSHLLAELIENALAFSPPGTPVVVTGRAAVDHYVINIIDDGMGIEPTDQAVLNARLAGAPGSGPSLSKFLGLEVVARLAQRYGITVQLSDSDIGGTHARVELPGALLEDPANPPAASPAPSLGADGSLFHRVAPAAPAPTSAQPAAATPLSPSAPVASTAPEAATAVGPSSAHLAWEPAAAATPEPSLTPPAVAAAPPVMPVLPPAMPLEWLAPPMAVPPVPEAVVPPALPAVAPPADAPAPTSPAAPPNGGVVPSLPTALLPPTANGVPVTNGVPPNGNPARVVEEPPASDGASAGVNGAPGPEWGMPYVPTVGNGFPTDVVWSGTDSGPSAAPAPQPGSALAADACTPADGSATAAREDDVAGRIADIGRNADVTSSGLRRRTPRATLAAAESAGEAGTPASAVEPPPFRDAAKVRDMLSQFQAGVIRAQHGLEQTPTPTDPEHGEA